MAAAVLQRTFQLWEIHEHSAASGSYFAGRPLRQMGIRAMGAHHVYTKLGRPPRPRDSLLVRQQEKETDRLVFCMILSSVVD